MSIWTRGILTIDRGGGFLSVQDTNNIIPVENGVRIMADKYTELIWHGGEVYTGGKWSFKYGYAEVSARLPKGKGLISAFYLFEPDTQAEIDIFEAIDPNCMNLQLTVHKDGTQANHEYVGNIDLSADYHRYGINWSESFVEWYLDGTRLWYQVERTPQIPLSVYLCLNIGGWPGLPDDTTPSPSYFDIEYLKVWQRL